MAKTSLNVNELEIVLYKQNDEEYIYKLCVTL